MAAPKGNKNGVGNSGGKSKNDRLLASRVRTKALEEIEKILDQDGLTEMKKQILLKLASSVLPRLNEHAGNDGEPIQVQWMSSSPTNPGTGPIGFTVQVNDG
jgi:hypothetical protein